MADAVLTRTREAYEEAFAREQTTRYPVIDAYEQRLGVAVPRGALEKAARVLACPLKAHPPCWQHGRVLYAAARRRLEALEDGATPALLMDIGTAKGFSALMLAWALGDAGVPGRVVSVDVVDPLARVARNTIAEVDGLQTLAETLRPWLAATAITFVHGDSRTWLTKHTDRVAVAFVDGKHTYEAVSWDAALLAARQDAGDVIVFDDLQIPGVARAVTELRHYDVARVWAHPARGYAIARKR